ncbi:hypothetical protein HX045_13050 [Myroides odoratimimus]|uniref:Uncharacterized protein n=2 Tax=Myroides odoratimimus TaxID=76832 RepID=A0A0S7EE56_9FLAO|nr:MULTISPECIES: hypothetical protein [Myroides]ALU27069.1 hypothetical protein AS202_13300 [Myroides odoratimimus]APA93091.1 hypothetical protein BK054_12850 [Myroides sp. ZB35]EHO08589.1 hypothetical protein HMPREF9712_02251 [Myroides odoratimimus CCUG 10230]EHO10654.1 hypothetical protein HMPREF9714_01618 [Myroides odoratimimus CCUG 12901]EKB07033.1 hypothetical protein HMPREF9711_00343 [Myroides odoratimimus CCUG 3837]
MTNKAIEDLNQIKSIMERSTKFLSLSGWSGIWVGLCGLIAASVLYYWQTSSTYSYENLTLEDPYQTAYTAEMLLVLAIATFVIAVVGGFFFTIRKTRKQGKSFLNQVTKRLLVRFSIPLIIAGILCLILHKYHLLQFALPTTLLFYGLALFSVQEDTVKEVKAIAALEIVLGLLAFYFLDYTLLLWAIGFGLVHLLYGIILWNKYDK